MSNGKKECCQKEENLSVSEQRDSMTIRVCKICNRKHYVLSVDVGEYEQKGKSELFSWESAPVGEFELKKGFEFRIVGF